MILFTVLTGFAISIKDFDVNVKIGLKVLSAAEIEKENILVQTMEGRQ